MASAAWTRTSTRWNRREGFWLPAPFAVPANPATTSARAAFRAGKAPNTAPVTSDSAIENAAMGQSSAISASWGRDAGRDRATVETTV